MPADATSRRAPSSSLSSTRSAHCGKDHSILRQQELWAEQGHVCRSSLAMLWSNTMAHHVDE